MTLRARAEEAFGHRRIPKKVVDIDRKPVTPEQEDAIWFLDKSWQTLTRADWEAHADAFFTFSPEAFIYYLPSILALSTENRKQPMLAAISLLRVLDRGPEVHHWDA